MKNTLQIALLSLTLAAFSPLVLADMEGKSAPAVSETDSFKGELTLVDFWASWCGPCQESFPWMNEMKKKYPDLNIIAINLDENREDAEAFLDDVGSNFTILFDPEGKLAEKYRVDGMPSSYLVDSDGKIVQQHVGFFSEQTSDYEADIQKLLNSQSAPAK